MLLSLRGWRDEDFRHASREVLEGVRWALFAEKAVVMLRDAEEMATLDVSPTLGIEALKERIPAKRAGEAQVAILRPILYPEDE